MDQLYLNSETWHHSHFDFDHPLVFSIGFHTFIFVSNFSSISVTIFGSISVIFLLVKYIWVLLRIFYGCGILEKTRISYIFVCDINIIQDISLDTYDTVIMTYWRLNIYLLFVSSYHKYKCSFYIQYITEFRSQPPWCRIAGPQMTHREMKVSDTWWQLWNEGSSQRSPKAET